MEVGVWVRFGKLYFPLFDANTAMYWLYETKVEYHKKKKMKKWIIKKKKNMLLACDYNLIMKMYQDDKMF